MRTAQSLCVASGPADHFAPSRSATATQGPFSGRLYGDSARFARRVDVLLAGKPNVISKGFMHPDGRLAAMACPWVSGMPARRGGYLVYWCSGLLVLWFSSPLVFMITQESSIPGNHGIQVYWSSGPLVYWFDSWCALPDVVRRNRKTCAE